MKKKMVSAILITLVATIMTWYPEPLLAVTNSHSIDLEKDNIQFLSIADANQAGLDPTGDWSVSFWINLESQPALNITYELISIELRELP